MMPERETPTIPPNTLPMELGAIVGAEHVRPAAPDDSIDGVQPRYVVEPVSADEVARVLRFGSYAGLRLAPRGGGTKLAWGNPPRAVDLVLSTRRMGRVVEHAWGDMTATVEAGCTVVAMQQVLAEHGQRLALDPLWPERATIGGILATNDSGALRLRFGSLRDQIIGITVALPDGTLAKSGGKVVKNVAGYDLPKLLTGSLGSLGVITEAIFRLYPRPRQSRSLSFATPMPDSMNQLVLAILDSSLTPSGLQIRVEAAGPLYVDVQFESVVAAALDAQASQLLSLARGAEPIDAPPKVWRAREALWEGVEPALVCKLSVLPAQLGALLQSITRVATPLRLGWRLVAYAVGLGWLRLEGPNEQALLAALGVLRPELEAQDGSLAALWAPPEVKSRIDVWAASGDALPLMCRVKEQFDPRGTLNPGRFVGGI